jgi:hypothetical protein
MNYSRKMSHFALFLLASATLGGSGCSSSKSGTEPQASISTPNEYTRAVGEADFDKRTLMLKSIEDFFAAVSTEALTARAKSIESENPVLSTLSGTDSAPWFGGLFETLVGAQLMAQSNSFRSYNNSHCLDAFVRPLGSTPLPPAAELMSLNDFMKAGPRIPDEPTYVGQVRLFCGRRSINLYQGLAPAQVTKIYLSLKNNVVLQKWILAKAASEATLILQAYRESL